MTILRLVTDEPDGNVPTEARHFADAIDSGELGKVNSAIVISSGSTLDVHYWGGGLNLIDAIGLLETAKIHIVKKLLDNA